jgi:hypothetical protein
MGSQGLQALLLGDSCRPMLVRTRGFLASQIRLILLRSYTELGNCRGCEYPLFLLSRPRLTYQIVRLPRTPISPSAR